MARIRYRLLFLLLFVPCQMSCTLLLPRPVSPIETVHCLQALPKGYEVHATVRVSSSDQHYLLAIGTGPERLQLALLAAQGIPVYRLVCEQGSPRVSMQTTLGEHLPPLVLLNYLGLIYMPSPQLSQQLRADWVLQEQLGERVLARPAGAVGIRVVYRGQAPWFSSVDLFDELNGVNLRLVILESSRVLSE